MSTYQDNAAALEAAYQDGHIETIHNVLQRIQQQQGYPAAYNHFVNIWTDGANPSHPPHSGIVTLYFSEQGRRRDTRSELLTEDIARVFYFVERTTVPVSLFILIVPY